MEDGELRRTAIHEAGHAVMAYRLSIYCGRLTIEPRGSTLGVSLSEAAWVDGSRDHEEIMVYLAGWEAERSYCENANHEGSISDQCAAAELLRLQPAGTEEDLRAKVAKMIGQDKCAIEAVAEALLEHMTMEDDEYTIVIDAVDEREDWREVLAELMRRKKWRGPAAGE